MKDLRSVSCDIMTIGQYLQPYERRLPVERYVTRRIREWKQIGLISAFNTSNLRPLTRSSYHARSKAKREMLEFSRI
jgi:lipoic acid synthetase